MKATTDRKVSQPSRHSKLEAPLQGIAEDVNFVYTRQHQTTGLQSQFEGPFRIAERISNSVFKLEVGTYKDGRKRYEYRHLNDLKAAHPKSLASPVERPKLGRPATRTSSSDEGSMATDATPGSAEQLPQPSSVNTNANQFQNKTKLPVARENSNSFSAPAPEPTGPPAVQPFSRPARTTRNPNPYYVDSIALDVTPWSATRDQINAINQSISNGQSRSPA